MVDRDERPEGADEEEWQRAVAAADRCTTLNIAMIAAIEQDVLEYSDLMLLLASQIVAIGHRFGKSWDEVACDAISARAIERSIDQGWLKVADDSDTPPV